MTERFMADVRRLFELQDQLKSVRDSIKDRATSLRGELAQADASVKAYMLDNGLEICNYQGQRLQLALNERPMPLTRAAIAAGLRKHLSEADAERCMLDMQAAAGTKRVAALRRARRTAARGPRAVARAAAQQPAAQQPAAQTAAQQPAAQQPAAQQPARALASPVQADFDAPPALDSDSD
jgi:hypothetical protein